MKPKNKTIKLVVILMIGLFLVNCASQVPFNNQLISKYNLTIEELDSLQFYLSERVILKREVTTIYKKEISGTHTLHSKEGKMIEEVTFKKMLPGIVESFNQGSINIKFEPIGSIEFTNSPGQFSKYREPTKSTKYYINLSKYNINMFDAFGIEYQGNVYQVDPTGWKSFLIVKEVDLDEIERKRRSVTGMRLK